MTEADWAGLFVLIVVILICIKADVLRKSLED
jgi:hypothetical protein